MIVRSLKPMFNKTYIKVRHCQSEKNVSSSLVGDSLVIARPDGCFPVMTVSRDESMMDLPTQQKDLLGFYLNAALDRD